MISFNNISLSLAGFSKASFLVSLVVGCVGFCVAAVLSYFRLCGTLAAIPPSRSSYNPASPYTSCTTGGAWGLASSPYSSSFSYSSCSISSSRLPSGGLSYKSCPSLILGAFF